MAKHYTLLNKNFIILAFTLSLFMCACSTDLNVPLNKILINEQEYTTNHSEYQKIELNKDQFDDKIVICIPEGAVGYSWVPFYYSDSLKLVKEEKITRKMPKDIDGESKYAQQFTFQIEKNASAKIVLKKLFIDDKEKQLDDPSIHWYNELEIVLP